MTRIIKILYFSANAPDSTARPRIRPDEEFREIGEKLRDGTYCHRFRLLEPLFATRINDLQARLSYDLPHVVHFAGHGSPSGIELEDEAGGIKTVNMQALMDIFGALRGRAYGSGDHRVNLVVLNACCTRVHAESLTAVSDFAIGTASEVWDKDAINFAASFYNSLANGLSLDSALVSGLGVTKIKNYNANHAPKLFSKEDADPTTPFIEHVLGPLPETPAAGGQPVPEIVTQSEHHAPIEIPKESAVWVRMKKRYNAYQEEMEKEKARLEELRASHRSVSRKRRKKN